MGVLVQPRYLMPLGLLLTAVMLYTPKGHSFTLKKIYFALIFVVVFIMQLLALMRLSMQLFAPPSFNISKFPEWASAPLWWPVPINLLPLATITSAAFGLALLLLMRDAEANQRGFSEGSERKIAAAELSAKN